MCGCTIVVARDWRDPHVADERGQTALTRLVRWVTPRDLQECVTLHGRFVSFCRKH